MAALGQDRGFGLRCHTMRLIRLIPPFLPALLLAFTMTAAHAMQPADLFDFWLGDWSVSWKNADGSTGRARNRITKTLDGQGIEENFEEDAGDPPPLLKGRSISVLHKASGIWRQAWADNQGGFFAFTASVDGDRRLFATEMRSEGDQVRGQRMVFYDIRPNRFMWDWEGTTDGGRTWSLLWRLEYRR